MEVRCCWSQCEIILYLEGGGTGRYNYQLASGVQPGHSLSWPAEHNYQISPGDLDQTPDQGGRLT